VNASPIGERDENASRSVFVAVARPLGSRKQSKLNNPAYKLVNTTRSDYSYFTIVDRSPGGARTREEALVAVSGGPLECRFGRDDPAPTAGSRRRSSVAGRRGQIRTVVVDVRPALLRDSASHLRRVQPSSEVLSITNRYFTSLRTIRPYASSILTMRRVTLRTGPRSIADIDVSDPGSWGCTGGRPG
jgi:hypothetical protein